MSDCCRDLSQSSGRSRKIRVTPTLINTCSRVYPLSFGVYSRCRRELLSLTCLTGSPSRAILPPCRVSNWRCLDPSRLSYNRTSIVSACDFAYRRRNSRQTHPEFVPYVFQLMSQMLELHASDVPADYRTLLPFLLQPASWQQKGSIPGLVRLLKAFLKRDGRQMAASGQFTSVLAVVQQKLIPSRINDTWGFELLQAILLNIPP